MLKMLIPTETHDPTLSKMNVHHIHQDPAHNNHLMLNGEMLMAPNDEEPVFPREIGEDLYRALYNHIQVFPGIEDGDAIFFDGQFVGFRDGVHFIALLPQPKDESMIYTFGDPKVYEPYIRSTPVAAKAPGGTVWRTLEEAKAALKNEKAPRKIYGVCASWEATKPDPDFPPEDPARALDGFGRLVALPSTPEAPRWTMTSYMSGTVVVSSNLPGWPHLHIGHVPGDDEGESLRSKVGREIEIWMNDGPLPEFLKGAKRSHAEGVTLLNGCGIDAHGPMVDEAIPPQFGLWKTDDSPAAAQRRRALIDLVEQGAASA